jgi:hypothetical protein
LKFALALKPSHKISKAYRLLGEKYGFKDWGIGDVYYGSVKEWIMQERKGLRKFKNFEKLVKKDERNNMNCRYVFIGDTGEKDEDAGERIIAKYSSKMKAMFLHFVTEDLENELPTDRIVNGVPVFYFKTYVGAAVKAFQNRLVSTDGLRRIAAEAHSDLLAMDNSVYQFGSIKKNFRNESDTMKSRWKDLENDLNSARLYCNDLKLTIPAKYA